MEINMRKKLLQGCLLSSIFVILSLVIVLGVFFVVKPDVAFAMQSAAHMARVLFRFDAEILSTTAYGRYYSALYWKHNTELIQIVQTHPDLYENTLQVTQLFMPHIEALLDNRGNEVRISQEAMDTLDASLIRFKSLASRELRVDIEREQDRTPLQAFVGMTVDEAMKFIESAWERDFPSAPLPTATIPPLVTTTPHP
jgi:hypothetical protein